MTRPVAQTLYPLQNHEPVKPNAWPKSKVGYEHIRDVHYSYSYLARNEYGVVVRIERKALMVADTSSVKEILIGGVAQRVCRLYENKCGCFTPVLPGCAVWLSLIGVITWPAYIAFRLAAVVIMTPFNGLKESAYRFVKMIFLCIAYLFDHLLTIGEGLLLSSDPINSRQRVQDDEMEMNEGVGLQESYWMTFTCGVFMEDFPAYKFTLFGYQFEIPDFRKGGFYVFGCCQASALGILDENDNVVGITLFKVKQNREWQMSKPDCSQFQPRPWIRPFQRLINAVQTKAEIKSTDGWLL